jgi:hypothetical protein
MWPEGLGKLKKFIYLIGSRTRDFSASCIVPLPLRYRVIAYKSMEIPVKPLLMLDPLSAATAQKLDVINSHRSFRVDTTGSQGAWSSLVSTALPCHNFSV